MISDGIAAGQRARDWRADPGVVRWLVIVLLVGLVLRVAAHLDLAQLPFVEAPQTDAAAYDEGARRVAAGDLALADQVAGMGPGYFYFLGAVYALLGDGPWAIRFVQTVIGLAAVFFVFLAATRVVAPRLALVPAGLAAAYAPALFFESQLLGDAIALALHAAALLLLLRARERRRLGRWLALGVAIGLGALFRPSALGLLLAAVAVALSRGAAPGLRAPAAIACAVFGAALAIAPITTRNLVVAREPVLITGHGGINLWLGNGPGATGAFRVCAEVPAATEPGAQYREFRAVGSATVGHPLSIAETDRYWTGRTVHHVLAHPFATARVLARKLHLFWNGRELSDVYRYEFLRDRSGVLRWLVGFAWIAPFAFLGLFVAARAAAGTASRAVFWVGVSELLSIAAVLVSARYRLVAVPVLLVLAALGAAALWQRLQHVRALPRGAAAARARVLVPPLLALAAGIALAVPVRARPSEAEGSVELARAWLSLGDVDAARSAYAEALVAAPAHLAALEEGAALAERTGQLDEARRLRESHARALAAARRAQPERPAGR